MWVYFDNNSIAIFLGSVSYNTSLLYGIPLKLQYVVLWMLERYN